MRSSLLFGLLPAAAIPGRRAVPITTGEHVVLADCLGPGTTVSSQMAYFPNNTGTKPQDVSVVSTPAGQAALWVSTNTSGLFTDTGVTFKAVLGPQGANGSFAGTGNNGYVNFTCWQRYSPNLYQYDNVGSCGRRPISASDIC